jgi:hypothetical protein
MIESETHMSKTPNIYNLGNKIAQGEATINEITIFINSLMPATVNQVNSMFAPR